MFHRKCLEKITDGDDHVCCEQAGHEGDHRCGETWQLSATNTYPLSLCQYHWPRTGAPAAEGGA